MGVGNANYLIAIGSNRRTRHGTPRATLAAAIAALPGVIAVSPIIQTPPIGPSRRRFANGALLIDSALSPPAMLELLKRHEAAFGRRRGRRWGERALDLDIILWSGGRWDSATLTIPHAAYRSRAFVLAPAAALAPGWRDPIGGATLAQLAVRIRHPRPVDQKRLDA